MLQVSRVDAKSTIASKLPCDGQRVSQLVADVGEGPPLALVVSALGHRRTMLSSSTSGARRPGGISGVTRTE
jgi:hypothetical protein